MTLSIEVKIFMLDKFEPDINLIVTAIQLFGLYHVKYASEFHTIYRAIRNS